mgnify:CR=1 FL=1
MNQKAWRKNSSKDEIKSLKEEVNELKKKKEIEALKAEVASIRSRPTSPPLSDPSWDDIKSKRLSSGLLGIFLGCFGAHKFALGYTGEGFIYLSISILGGIITCGIATAIAYTLSMIESIMYLTKTHEEFKRLYIDKKTAWF